jgi:hypothetical protein
MKKLVSLALTGAIIAGGCFNTNNRINKAAINEGLSACITSQNKVNSDRVMDKHNKFFDCFNKASNIKYKEDGDQDYWQTPKETEKLGTGDCEDKTIYLMELLKKEGYKSEFTYGFYHESDPNFYGNICHAWTEMDYGGERYILDPTAGAIYLRKLRGPSEYFRIKEDSLDKKYEECQKRAGNQNVESNKAG